MFCELNIEIAYDYVEGQLLTLLIHYCIFKTLWFKFSLILIVIYLLWELQHVA